MGKGKSDYQNLLNMFFSFFINGVSVMILAIAEDKFFDVTHLGGFQIRPVHSQSDGVWYINFYRGTGLPDPDNSLVFLGRTKTTDWIDHHASALNATQRTASQVAGKDNQDKWLTVFGRAISSRMEQEHIIDFAFIKGSTGSRLPREGQMGILLRDEIKLFFR